jgi:stress response protein YsnF
MAGTQAETRPSGKELFQEERIEVPLSREEPVVEKQTRVTGGVRIRKTEGVEQESVRREEVDVDESGTASRKGRQGIDPGDPRSAGADLKLV